MLYFYDRGKELEEAGIPNPYSRQGEEQPFGYTGYRYDSISDTYFAQAREYNPKTGRFMAEYYSYSTVSGQHLGKIFDVPNFGRRYEGRLFANVSEEENPELIKQEELPIEEFIRDGKVNERWYSNGNWHERENGIGSDSFTRAIIIPITNEQGSKIHDAAQKMIDEGSTYNLWDNNCVQVARELISAGGEELVISRDLSWEKEYPIAGLIWHSSLVSGSDYIPNKDYILALIAAGYYGYEIIDIGPKDEAISEECIAD